MAYVNSASARATGTGTTVSSSAFVATAGNLIAVGVGTYVNSTVASVTDTAGNTYSLVQRFAGSHGTVEVWAATNVTGHASNVVTVTFTASLTTARACIVHQYSGRATVTPVDGTATGSVTQGFSVTTASFSPAASGADVFAVRQSQGSDSAWVAGANYTLRVTTVTDFKSEDRVSAPAGAQTASMSWTGDATAGMLAVAFKVQGTNREVTGAPATTFALAGKPAIDRYLVSTLEALKYVLSGSLSHDVQLESVLAALSFTLDGVLTRPDLIIEQAGRVFDFAIFTPASLLEVKPPEIVHTWGLRVDRHGRVVNPNLFYLGVRGGLTVPALSTGPSEKRVTGIYSPLAVLFGAGAGPIRDVSVFTRQISGALRVAAFSPAGMVNGAQINIKLITGRTTLTYGFAGSVSTVNATIPPEDGSTPWEPAAGDPSWTNVVTDHGAAGDGVTNDHAAFAAAMATGKKVYVPKTASYYRITGVPLNLTNDLYGDGEWPEIRKFCDGSSGSQIIRVRDIHRSAASPLRIQGLVIDGERSGTDSYNSGEWGHSILISKCDWVEVRYNSLLNAQGDAVCVGGEAFQGGVASPNRSTNITVRHNQIYNAFRGGVGAVNVDGLVVHNNNIEKTSNLGGVIAVLPTATYNGEDGQTDNVTIRNNAVWSTRVVGVRLFHPADGYPSSGRAGINISIRDNTGAVFTPKVAQTGIFTNVSITGNVW